MIRFFIKKTYADEEKPYWISFSDAISGILIIFILVTVWLMNNLQQKENLVNEQLDKITNLRQREHQLLQKENRVNEQLDHIRSLQQRERQLNQELNQDITRIQEELEKEGIRVEIDKNIMRIPTSEIHFENNDANIPLDKIYNVRKIGIKVMEYVRKDENKNIDTVFIEGHTDCNPTKRDRGNLGLSTDRAISIAEEWALLDKNFWNIKNKDGKSLFSVSGYGEKRPIEGTLLNGCKNESVENLQRNRRIDIRFVIGRPKITGIDYME